MEKAVSQLRKQIDFAIDMADHERAMGLIEDLARLLPAEAHFLRGSIKFKKGEFERAEKDFHSALRDGNLHIQTYAMIHLANLANIQNDGEREKEFTSDAIKYATHPDVCLEIKSLEAYILGAQGNHQKAIDLLTQIQPLVDCVSKFRPIKKLRFLNTMAYNLGCVGLAEKGLNLLTPCLRSKFLASNEEWKKTKIELGRQAMRSKKVYAPVVKPPPQNNIRLISEYRKSLKPIKDLEFLLKLQAIEDIYALADPSTQTLESLNAARDVLRLAIRLKVRKSE